jgi:CRP-like cAMP-binding protein
MLLNVECVILLRSVEIFKQIPDNVLADLANILDEETYPAGYDVINSGDVGNFMYIIQAGRVKVHKNNTVLAELGKHDIVGELSVLSPRPRTASVTTLEDTYLLKIEREPFIELLSQEIELMKSILTVLTDRIINQNKKIGELESRFKAK